MAVVWCSLEESKLTQRQADPPSALGMQRDFWSFGFGKIGLSSSSRRAAYANR